MIYKGAGEKNLVTNYRPITLSNVGYKLTTTLLTARLGTLLERHNVFTNAQGGFRTRRGCHQKIALSVTLRRHAAARNRPLAAVFVDLKKAYDSVPHSALWATLRAMRMPEQSSAVSTPRKMRPMVTLSKQLTPSKKYQIPLRSMWQLTMVD